MTITGSRKCVLTRRQTFITLGVLVPLLCAADGRWSGPHEGLVEAQRVIEQVYWNHRIWPADNPGRKPGLSEILPEATIRARVDDGLRKSNALQILWHRPITPTQLQAEMNRMARRTQDARMLQELFAALGNDPRLIAETLARQTLADRLIRNWYAVDARVHGELRRRVEAAVAACPDVACLRSLGGDYHETTWRLGDPAPKAPAAAETRKDDVLDAGEWDALLARLAEAFDRPPEAVPVLEISPIEETPDAFLVTAVLFRAKDAITTASVTWPKESFDAWWRRERERFEPRIDASAFSFTLPELALTPCTPGTWTPTNANVPPVGRHGTTAVWTGSEMIVWGGYSPLTNAAFLRTGGRYNPSTDTWNPTISGQDVNVPDPRFNHTAVWTGTEMIVWGGQGEPSTLNRGGRYDPSSDRWVSTSTGIGVPTARANHTAVWTGTQMIIWGGTGDSSGGRYDPSTDTWSPTSTGANVPTPRAGHTAVWAGTRMIVWGATGDSSGGRYDPSTDSWSPTSAGPNVPTPRSGHTATWTGTRMIVWGGQTFAATPESLNSGGRYDPSTDTWAAVSTGLNRPEGRSRHSAVWTGIELIIWGGVVYDTSTTYRYLNTGGRYDPSSDTWAPTSAGLAAPAARSGQIAVWTGTEMIVWGGFNGTDLGTGGRYAPSSDTWAPTLSVSALPSARRSHQAVWTGTEMIVWGGSNIVRLNTGGRYEPATDSWGSTSTGANVPSARSAFSALWTGTHMIIWGGSDASGNSLNSGGRYNPSSNTWLPTSTGTNAPSPRGGLGPVWTGTEMIVWGGLEAHCELVCDGDCCFEFFNTGARYDPSTDTWTPTSTGANVPEPRYFHSAVWSGTRMIVWGGRDVVTENSRNDGGLYDPSTDTWTPTSTGPNVPQPRDGHNVAWTGTEMLVWGGNDNGNPTLDASLTSGGRYDPAADSWSPMSVANAPQPRFSHRAVWGETSFIVWGGNTYDDQRAIRFLNTGAQYFPSTDLWIPTSTGANTPEPRASFSAVPAGTEMIVWGGLIRSGGESATPTGGRYCPCVSGAVYHRDGDGDGYGDPAVVTTSCDGSIPAGYVTDQGDCDDANSFVHPGTVEICNGVDDDCSGTIDDAAPPGPVGGVAMRGDAPVIEWQPLATAQFYDVVYGDAGTLIGSGGNFTVATSGCMEDGTPQTSVPVTISPAAGRAIWLLVRGHNCGGAGTYDGESGQVGARDPEIAAASAHCP